ncbi:squalene synthase HpnC [Acidovorax sp. Leaf160]|nr:squalene synthase HpnC [Acidovorax sp. Leaf160]
MRAVKPSEPHRPAPSGTAAQSAPTPVPSPAPPRAAAASPGQGAPLAPPVTHYENFPVASLLCPPRLRQPIAAIYSFARAADDLADEGDASADERLADLCAYRAELQAVAGGAVPGPRWAAIFGPLQAVLQSHALPVPLLDDLLDAFLQDIAMTRDGATYATRAALLDYCRRSANPVGRLLLHLYGVGGAAALAESDAICSALQLINFWQDLSVDLPRGRHYLTDADCAAHGVERTQLAEGRRSPATDALVMDCAGWARRTMLAGAPLVHRLPGRMGWELRFVVQGGLRILDKVEALHGGSLVTRPVLRATDGPRLAWRALRM